MGRTWRDIAAPIIAKALKDNKDKSENEIRKALFGAYPFGSRQYHPYKIWLDEIKIQRGKKVRGERGGKNDTSSNYKLF